MIEEDDEHKQVAVVEEAGAKPPETDDERTARCAGELRALLVTHRENVARAHADYPTPLVPYRKKARWGFSAMNPAERKRANQKRAVVKSACKAYHRAVRAAVEKHQADGPNTSAVVAAGMAAHRVAEDRRRERAAR
jgi:hypothetical protein